MRPFRATIAAFGLAAAVMGCDRPVGAETDIVGHVRDNNAAAVRAYLAEGGDPDVTSRDGQPLLYLAAGPRGGLDVLVVLIEGGAAVDARAGNGRTALMNAAGWCDSAIIRVLLAAGANPRITDGENRTARESVCAGPLDLRAEVLNILDAAVLGN